MWVQPRADCYHDSPPGPVSSSTSMPFSQPKSVREYGDHAPGFWSDFAMLSMQTVFPIWHVFGCRSETYRRLLFESCEDLASDDIFECCATHSPFSFALNVDRCV
ncbi:hypothetical protein KC19_12G104300 [Ceratodon purpureus]|uniref:Uncharacterized protein n=1 Tax=Ceratodon purpureus TaxID=3225 RepID=A0A8T0G8D6_CERPU|nr:hypothetical protein KC19_12G104300 [Ceratodon purpureus]